MSATKQNARHQTKMFEMFVCNKLTKTLANFLWRTLCYAGLFKINMEKTPLSMRFLFSDQFLTKTVEKKAFKTNFGRGLRPNEIHTKDVKMGHKMKTTVPYNEFLDTLYWEYC